MIRTYGPPRHVASSASTEHLPLTRQPDARFYLINEPFYKAGNFYYQIIRLSDYQIIRLSDYQIISFAHLILYFSHEFHEFTRINLPSGFHLGLSLSLSLSLSLRLLIPRLKFLAFHTKLF